jgi:hypothetical protein
MLPPTVMEQDTRLSSIGEAHEIGVTKRCVEHITMPAKIGNLVEPLVILILSGRITADERKARSLLTIQSLRIDARVGKGGTTFRRQSAITNDI